MMLTPNKLTKRLALTTFSLTFLSMSAISQNYGIVKPYNPTFFENNDGDILALSVDSFRFHLSDAIYTLHDASNGRPSIRHPNKTIQESFLGNEIRISKNGTTEISSFYEQETYTICHSCTVGQSWVVSEKPYISGAVKDVVLDTVNGQLDSVKIITLDNQYEMHIAQKNGLVRSPQFFPSRSSHVFFERTKTTTLSHRDIYDMNVDDEFHWKVYAGSRKVFEKHILKIKSKELFLDSVKYRVKRSRYKDSKVVSDEVEWRFPYSSSPLFSALPGEWFTIDSIGDSTKNFNYFYRNKSTWYFGDSRWDRPYIYFIYPPKAEYQYYVKGCGKYYKAQYGTKPAEYQERSLVYYKKGEETWGLGFAVNHKQPVQKTVSLFPNPVNSILYISGLEKPNTVCHIFNIQGSLILEAKVDNDQLDVSSLAQGIYLLHLPNNQVTRFTIAR